MTRCEQPLPKGIREIRESAANTHVTLIMACPYPSFRSREAVVDIARQAFGLPAQTETSSIPPQSAAKTPDKAA